MKEGYVGRGIVRSRTRVCLSRLNPLCRPTQHEGVHAFEVTSQSHPGCRRRARHGGAGRRGDRSETAEGEVRDTAVGGIERQFCAIKVDIGPRCRKSDTQVAGDRFHCRALEEHARRRVGPGDRRSQARHRADRFSPAGRPRVRVNLRPQGPEARDPGLPAGRQLRAGVRYVFTKLPKAKSSNYATKLVRVGITAGSKARLAALGLDLTDHPTATYWDLLLHSPPTRRSSRRPASSYIDPDRRRGAQATAPTAARSSAWPPSRRRQEGAHRRRAQRPDVLPHAGRDRDRTEGAGRRQPRSRPALRAARASGRAARSSASRSPRTSTATDDGRPVFVQVGTHHAREWPANEATLEWGLELINGYKAGNAADRRDRQERAQLDHPVLNVDGFDVTIKSEGITPGGNYADPDELDRRSSGDQASAPAPTSARTAGRRRRRRRRPRRDCLARSYPNAAARRATTASTSTATTASSGAARARAPTRPDPDFQTYHGPAPFSEPETQRVPRLRRELQPTVLITNHTFTGLMLRPPGTAPLRPGTGRGAAEGAR